ncbi:hypothetical protein SAMN05880561_102453 [Rhizobium sp. RU33A]|uniref:hypothetical protein n=1 Tax=Rhizobium sp. RU33A TaxID=1907413 RepID=UPI0009569ADC|nr:hypothetical protein [Rhizobium sp. RU33A]SIQ26311.1 hypothetical protein SAMN05880561_102453 [Rhizobium sp. RU33A]
MSGQLERIALSHETISRLRSSAAQSQRYERELLEEAVVEYLDRHEMELAAVENGMALAGADGLISHDAMKALASELGNVRRSPSP